MDRNRTFLALGLASGMGLGFISGYLTGQVVEYNTKNCNNSTVGFKKSEQQPVRPYSNPSFALSKNQENPILR